MKMKKLLLIALVAMTAIACSKSEESIGVVDCPEGMGIVSVGVSPSVVVDGTRAQQQIPDGTTIPAGDEFKLGIVTEDLNVDYPGEEWESVALFNKNYKKTFFKAGLYRATVTYGNPSEEGVNKPYYMGETGFNVQPRQKIDVKLTPALANSIVKVEFSDMFKRYFENGAAITITSGNGNKWNVGYGIANANGDNNADGSTPYLFVESGKVLSIAGYAVKQKPSATIDAPQVEFSAVNKTMVACTMYTYTYDVSTAGNVVVTVNITNEPREEITVSEEELNDDALE